MYKPFQSLGKLAHSTLHKEHFSRRDMLIVTAEVSGLALVGGFLYRSIFVSDNISFKDAKQFFSLRQTYLDDLLNRKDEVGSHNWNSITRLLYDPEFKQFFKDTGLSEFPNSLDVYTNPKDVNVVIPMGITYKKKEQKVHVYIGKTPFEVFDVEDDFLLVIDNEAYDASISEQGFSIRLSKRFLKGLPSKRVRKVTTEFLGFETGYFNVEAGKRKPSRAGLKVLKKPGQNLYDEIVRLSYYDDVDGNFCKGLLDYVKKRNTQKYFQ